MSISLDNYKNYFFLGIGGISMSALALIMHRRGYGVSGYDRRCTEATKKLEGEGICVYYTHDASHCRKSDICVFSAAFHEDNEEMKAVRDAGIPMISRAELLGSIAGDYPNSIAVAGTHGKSTTSGMLSQIFLSSRSSDPTILVGAELPAISSTFRTGKDGNFIFEACEYMDSFLQFYPTVCVVLNVEYDHTDYFHSIEQMTASFTRFLKNSKSKTAIVNADSPHALEAARNSGCMIHTYALNDTSAEFTAASITFNEGHASFDVERNGQFLLHADLSVPGTHNISNALAAVAAAVISDVSTDAIREGLHAFCGVCRRFEYKGKCGGATSMDDYAHHPQEIAATLEAARRICTGRIIAVFEPHTYTRLHDFLPEFAKALSAADVVFIAPIYAAREENIYNYTSRTLSSLIPGAQGFDTFEQTQNAVCTVAKKGDLILTMGAGDINRFAAKLVEAPSSVGKTKG